MTSRLLGIPTPARQDPDSGSLLSALAYDDDAASLHSRSDQDTDSEDDALQQRARNSRELAAHDRIVLLDEEETDKLVTASRAGRHQPGGSGSAGPLLTKAAMLLARRLSNGAGAANPPSELDSGRSWTNRSAQGPATPTDEQEKRRARRQRRERRKDRLLSQAEHGEDGALMYELEEGGMRAGSDTGDSSGRDDSGHLDRQKLLLVHDPQQHHHQHSKCRRHDHRWVRLLIYSAALIGSALGVLALWKLSIPSRSRAPDPSAVRVVVSNGTALFAPTSIIISLDGFRADFLQRGLTPTLAAFVQEGVSPKYMLPSFPSVTFPNHYTLATGLYPESHGIVGNSFWDPALQEEFYYTDPHRSLDAKWWAGEPFWVTAELQGIRTAIHMWPGSEAHILGVAPSFVDRFQSNETLDHKASRILAFLDMPGLESAAVGPKAARPQIIAAYVPNVDSDGHTYGPNSSEIRSTIQAADSMLGAIFRGLEARNLTQIVNVMVVSDHGMATTDTTRLLQIEHLVDMDKIQHNDGWPLYGLRPRNESDVHAIYDGLTQKAKTNPNFDVYLRDVDMPERYHFSNNRRIAPLWIVPKPGWAIVTKEEMLVADALATGAIYHPRGLHGYDHEHPLMRAIFVARGPAFPHPPNSQIANFQNINVYNILCDSVGMTPRPNNGTLRLPLSPVGLHDPGNTPQAPQDPVPPNRVSSASARPSLASSRSPSAAAAVQALETAPDTRPATFPASSRSTIVPAPTSSKTQDDAKDEAEIKQIESAIEGFWEWITAEAEKAWAKISAKEGGGGQSD